VVNGYHIAINLVGADDAGLYFPGSSKSGAWN